MRSKQGEARRERRVFSAEFKAEAVRMMTKRDTALCCADWLAL
jgi:transposase-like protein